MVDDKFLLLKNKGNIGERFFSERHNELLQRQIALLVDMSSWHIEGSDIGAERLQMTLIKGIKGLINGFDKLPEDLSGYSKYRLKMQYGGIEVKNIGSDQFLPRYGINDDPNGTLGFGIWLGTEDLPNGRTDYTRTSHGNLKRWMQPSINNRGARPMILVFLLSTVYVDRTNGKDKERFFASVIFEDVDVLLERLKEYAASFNLNLDKWDTIPIGDDAKGFSIPGLLLQGNMWHVPINVIGDLATVTMIGCDPEIYPTGNCSAEVQYSRLNYLKELADGRWIPQEKQTQIDTENDDFLLDLWHRRLMMGQPHYPDQRDIDGNLIKT